MLVRHSEPWSEMNRLSREMDRLFNARGGSNGRSVAAGRYPALNIWEDTVHLFVEAELPGFLLKDLEIYVTGNQLTMRGERRRPESNGGAWHRQEREYGKFTRMVELPGELNGEKVSAEFKNGVLTITLPKSEAVKPRRIEVQAT